jgi:hypothetical protein
LTRPEASPESLGVAPDIASIISDGKPRPAPAPIRTIGGMMSTTYDPSTGVRANSSSPAPMNTRLGISVASGPKRMFSGPERRSDITPMTIVDGRNARPTWSAS